MAWELIELSKECKHIEVMKDNGNKWCIDCGTSLGAPFSKEVV